MSQKQRQIAKAEHRQRQTLHALSDILGQQRQEGRDNQQQRKCGKKGTGLPDRQRSHGEAKCEQRDVVVGGQVDEPPILSQGLPDQQTHEHKHAHSTGQAGERINRRDQCPDDPALKEGPLG